MAGAIRIVVLDDIAAEARLAARSLGALGFEVQVATSFLELGRLIESFAPQIILTDVKMPDVSGDVLCRVLKKDYATASTLVLLYSSLDEQSLSRLAKRSGADGYVCKDWGDEALKKRLSELLDQVIF